MRVLLFILGFTAVNAFCQELPDPVFGTVPFDRWMAGPHHAQIPWRVTVFPVLLDNHQRLGVAITIAVEGKELVRRPARGQLRMLVQFNDEEGRAYEDHGTLELKDVNPRTRQSDFVYTHEALVRPGDYRLGPALVHTMTREHRFPRRTLHVEPLN